MNIARLNFSHGTHEVWAARVFLCTVSRNYSTYTHTFWSFFPVVYWFSVCLPVPRWNHQKHPRGGGDDNLWPLVLSAGCHRLGYEGSRDPHRISERGKHVNIHHLSNSLNLGSGCYQPFFGGKSAGCVSSSAFSSSSHCVVLCVAVTCRLLCWTNNCKLLETSLCLDYALHDMQAAHWFSLTVSLF